MADETPIQVLKEEGRRPQSKSYVWLVCTGDGGEIPGYCLMAEAMGNTKGHEKDSMIETAKANEIDSQKYLSFLLEHHPSAEMSDEELGQFASWSELA